MYITKRYVQGLNKKDTKKQAQLIQKSKRLYSTQKYYTRPKLKSFKPKESKHIIKAKKVYFIDSIRPSNELAKRTKCALPGLKAIVKKGQGAYYSSGSRPSQTAHSWGIARLASSLTGGKSSGIDIHILSHHCHKDSRALNLAKTYKQGSKKIAKIKVKR